MSVKRSDRCDDDLPLFLEEDLLVLDRADQVMSPSLAGKADIESSGFVPATIDNLSHLAPGCFVLIRADEVFAWVEVVAVDGAAIHGRVHSELSNSTCLIQHHSTEMVVFHRDQIRALGCERYCWC